MSNSQETINTYNKIAEQYSSSHFHPSFWQKEFNIFTDLIPDKKVIEIGCGAGRDASLFTEAGFDYLGTDASESMIKVAQKRVPQGRFEVQSFYDLHLPRGSFDGFWTAATLLHIPKADLPPVLQSIRALLKPDGIGFISVKEKGELDEGLLEENKYGGIKRYFAFYTEDEFKDILNKNGFHVLQNHILVEEDDIKTRWLCFFVKLI